jgi:tRNA threonylcarbamoyladenosine biosynthesis protein TsaE
VSDLGGGKTTLVRGIARGFGSTDKVASPTFTVSRVYTKDNQRLVHYDFYRLHDPGLLQFELAESIDDSQTVTIIEWADIVHDVLPESRLTIKITSISETDRTITLEAPSSLSYLLKEKTTV